MRWSSTSRTSSAFRSILRRGHRQGPGRRPPRGPISSQQRTHGLALTAPAIPESVGIGGLTTGGGVGFMVRKYGFAIDNLLSAQVVLAEWQHRHTLRNESHPRASSGRFAAAAATSASSPASSSGCTRSADRSVGGMLVLPATPGGDRGLRRRGRGGARGAVDDRQRHAGTADAVPTAGVARPARRHGADASTPATVDDGQRAVAPFRALAEPVRRPGQADAATTEMYPGRGSARLRSPLRRRNAVRRRDSTGRGRRRSSSSSSRPRRRRWPQPSSGCWAGPMATCPGGRDRVRAPLAPDHGERGRGLRAARGGRPRTTRWVERSRSDAPRWRHRRATSTSSATRAKRGSTPPTRVRPGTG